MLSSLGGAAGAVDEESFISSFEDCKKVYKSVLISPKAENP